MVWSNLPTTGGETKVQLLGPIPAEIESTGMRGRL